MPVHRFLLLLLLLFFSKHGILQAQMTSFLSEQERELRVQKASQLRREENYAGAIQQLDSILHHNPVDAGILLFKGDLLLQSKNFEKAVTTYRQLFPLQYEPTITKINLSYALFMSHKPANALQIAQLAWKQDKNNGYATLNYFNALLWNSKTKEADLFLQQQTELLTPEQVLVLRARLLTAAGDYKRGLASYEQLVNTYPNKYYIQEFAEVLLGKREIEKSARLVKEHENRFTTNEFKSFQQKLNETQQQQAGTGFAYFKDVAGNACAENTVWWQQGEGRVYRIKLEAGVRALTSSQQEKTILHHAGMVINERWSKSLTGETLLHLQQIKSKGNTGFASFAAKQAIRYQPNDRRMFGAFINTGILDFTASLTEKRLRNTSAGYMTHLLLTGKTGIYSQGSIGILTDKNRSYQVFGSLYHLFRTEPTLKAGINFSLLHFKDSSIKTYFSPHRYVSNELFLYYRTALPHLSKFYLQVKAGTGIQKIEKQKWDLVFRMQSELGLRLKYFETSLKYETSNIAAAAGAGYSFNRVTIRAACKW